MRIPGILTGIIFFAMAALIFSGIPSSPSRTEAATAKAAVGTSFDSAAADMVLIPAGKFLFGSSSKDVEWAMLKFFSESAEWYQSETPAMEVYMDAYFIDKHEVSVAQYQAFREATHREPPKYFDDEKFNPPNHPVVGVDWKTAMDYCQWAGKRLPNEAEWEKAARGVDGRYFPWGNTIDHNLANLRGRKDSHRYTAPVGSFANGASPYGVLDMAGNVWEWMENWYMPYPGNQQKSDLFGKKLKAIRGGAWNTTIDLARSNTRGKSLPDRKHNSIGLRCVADKK